MGKEYNFNNFGAHQIKFSILVGAVRPVQRLRPIR